MRHLIDCKISVNLCFLGVFLFGFYGPFKTISLISSQSFIKDWRKLEKSRKNHLNIRKQNLSTLLSTMLQGPASVSLSMNWIKNEIIFYHISELMLATLIQRYDRETN